ncbi:3-ketoacyl-CoA thiolase-like protein [Leptotrombidium deliense]|uniref:3-ketoacyl-CoA thiolase-like protein n=1 Tax=Leptotrombidium deliense TaxID=299467 RepID=A0A443SHN2_9ACAR|nr:3-ketoacyl-CoA thiolase-like protein [Leptotrombidium deliense]
MSSLLRGVFVVGAKRTAFGAYGGKLKDTSSIELGEIAAKAALSAAGVKPDLVDSAVVGNIGQSSSPAGPYIARHVALRAGVPNHVPCLTINRLCGSGFQAVVTGAQDICLRDSEIVLTAGSESMSQAPFIIRGARFGVKFSQTPQMECALWTTLTDHHVKMPMGITAENLAEKYNISREESDKFALRSQQNWKKAQDSGWFKEEMAPIMFKNKKTGKEDAFDVDEHPRPQTTLESLAKLPAVFKKDGTVTAGNASGVCDGAGAVVLASEDAVQKHSLKPLARIVGYCSMGCDPKIMGIGPVPAIRKLCERTGISLDKVDLVDINEAFAPQTLACMKELNINESKFNVCGGAIALGHPVGASGSRITANVIHELRRRGGKYAIGAACIGGGQGIAILFENI